MPILLLASVFILSNMAVAASATKDLLLCPDGKTIETSNKGSKQQRANTADLVMQEKQIWFRDLPGWNNKKSPETLWQAVRNNCKTRNLPSGWAKVCNEIKSIKKDNIHRYIEQNFTPYQLIVNNDKRGQFTSYYASYVNISKIKNATYRYPIYKVSQQAKSLSRKQIEQGGLPESEVLYWSDNAFDVYTLSVQGSGVGIFADGKKIKILYGAKNNHSYVSLAKVLTECEEIQSAEMSLPAIKQWVNNASAQQYKRLIDNNQSYVYFRQAPYNGAGPVGSLGVPLTAMRSMAVDRRYIALGTMMYIQVNNPLNQQKIERALLAQDTGGAINGGLRADIFAGEGASAEQFAGLMKNFGHFWLIKPNMAKPFTNTN
jgi:membrane-bound lytic murein transglycosylase A